MPRIRTIKPSFFRSDDVSVLPLRTRLTWIGLWTQCDDQGRTKDHVKLIKADVWPLDPVSLADIEEDLRILADRGRIVRYEVAGQRYLEVTNWSDHQKIDRPSKAVIPPPSYPQTSTRRTLDEPSLQEGKGKEGKGRDARASHEPKHAALTDTDPEPPRNCEEHIDERNPPPCGSCKDARGAYEQWHADRRRLVAAAPKCLTHRGQLASNCAMCASELKGAA